MHSKQAKHLSRKDPVLAEVIKKVKLNQLSPRRDRFEALVEAIVSQQLSVKAADTIFKRFAALGKRGKFPAPREVALMRPAKIRSVGLSKMKASFIKDLAKRVNARELDLHAMDEWTDERVVEELIKVRGIGPWTVEMFLIFSLCREDIFSAGDLGLRNAIQKLYKLKKHPSEKAARKIAESWRPYRSLACRYLWAVLDSR